MLTDRVKADRASVDAFLDDGTETAIGEVVRPKDHGKQKSITLDAEIRNRPDHVIGIGAAGFGVASAMHPAKHWIRKEAL